MCRSIAPCTKSIVGGGFSDCCVNRCSVVGERFVDALADCQRHWRRCLKNPPNASTNPSPTTEHLFTQQSLPSAHRTILLYRERSNDTLTACQSERGPIEGMGGAVRASALFDERELCVAQRLGL